MRGTYRIIIQNKRVRYDFVIRRNLTVIRGDSATGKTTLIEMVREYYENGAESGIKLNCERQCAVLSGNKWEQNLAFLKESIVFIDEGNKFVLTDEFASLIQRTDNYYVIVTRDGIPSLPYSIEEIYGIQSSGKYGTLRQTYHEFYHLYPAENLTGEVLPNIVIVEDSNSGYQFFRNALGNTEIECISAGGKSNIFLKVVERLETLSYSQILVIADGAAFGAEMEKMIRLIKEHREINLYLPESFEWLILESDVLNDKEIRVMSEKWGDYIESSQYFSWEWFFTEVLLEKSRDGYLEYNKKNLNKAYLTEAVKRKILKQVKWWKET